MGKKERLFELMSKIDLSFKPMLNENYTNQLNEDRTTYTNLLQMFQENNLRPGSFIAVGYVNAVDIPKRIFPTDANEEYARKLIEAAESHNLSGLEIKLLKEFISDEIWQKTKAGEIQLKSKKAPKRYFEWDNRFAGIIQFNRYVLNYMDRASLAKSFQDKREKEIELRRKHGFGKDDDQYPEDDWRRKVGRTGRPKYRGVGVEPLVDPRDADRGSTYLDKLGDFPLYGDVDKEGKPRRDPETGYQRMSLRQNISSNLKRLDTDYFLVDEEGNLNQVTYKFVNFFSKYVKEVRDNVVDELQEDEKQFVEELKEMESKYFSTQFISDRIAFITATVEDDKTKEKKPVYFYNDRLDVLQQYPVNIEQLQTHINQYMKDSYEKANTMAKSDVPLGENKLNKKQVIMENNKKQRLFEVMQRLDPSFKPKLNENQINEGMHIGVGNYNYDENPQTVLDVTHLLNNAAWNKKLITDRSFQPDGMDAMETKGVINFYLSGVPEENIQPALDVVRQTLQEKNIEFGEFSQEGTRVIRIPIDVPEYTGPPALSITYGSANELFTTLGLPYDSESYHVNYSVDDVLNAINRTKQEGGSHRYMEHLEKMATWAKQNGYDRITGA